MSVLRRLGLLAAALLLAGCQTLLPQPPALDDEPPAYPAAAPERPRGGGLFVSGAGNGLMADQRAYRVGDVLTVMLQEVTQASKQANTQTSKGSGVGVEAPVFDGKAIAGSIGLKSGSDFKGGGRSTQQNALSGAMTVIVQQVLPNGLLYIKGDRALTLNQGDEILRLSGYVRASDVDAHNYISSLRVANARISYSGHGALSDANQAGWLTRFFQSPIFPF